MVLSLSWISRRNIFFPFLSLIIAGYFGYKYFVPRKLDPTKIRFEIRPGEWRSLSEFSGKPVLVHFYANWCQPCMKELPSLSAKAPALKEMGIEVLCLTDDEWPEIHRTFRSLDGELELCRMESSLRSQGIYSIPETHIFSANGECLDIVKGVSDWSDPQWDIYFGAHFGR